MFCLSCKLERKEVVKCELTDWGRDQIIGEYDVYRCPECGIGYEVFDPSERSAAIEALTEEMWEAVRKSGAPF